MKILVDKDCILWDVVTCLDTRSTAPNTVSTRRFLVYAERPAFQAKLCEELPDGSLKTISDIPSIKEGSANIEIEPNKILVYCTSRLEPSGDFKLVVFDFDVTGVFPIDLAAAARIRNISRSVIKPFVSEATPTIDPYCK